MSAHATELDRPDVMKPREKRSDGQLELRVMLPSLSAAYRDIARVLPRVAAHASVWLLGGTRAI